MDPEWAARRYATAVRERNVIGYLDPHGTATVTGAGLPVEQATNACAHVEELARAAKRAGHSSPIGPLRANIYLGLLDGRWQHHTREQIITDLLIRAGDDINSTSVPSDALGSDDADWPGTARQRAAVCASSSVRTATQVGATCHGAPGMTSG